MMRLTRLLLIALFCAAASAGVLGAGVSSAAAQGNDARYQGQLESAIEDYDVLMIDEALETLREAIAQAQRDGASGPVVAKLHVMLGIVQFAETHDEKAAEKAFIQALKHDYQADVPPVYANPKLTDALIRARAQVPAPQAGPGPGAPAGEVASLGHERVRTARAGEPVDITITVPAEMPVYHVYLYYRRFGESEYQRLEMSASGATGFVAKIPGAQVNTSQVEYFVEALNRADAHLGEVGSRTTPLVITVLGSSGASVADPGKRGDEDDDLTRQPGAPEIPGGQKFYVMVAGGSGMGVALSGNPTAHPEREISPGLAPTFGHAMLDFGYMITPKAHLGMYLRWQFAPTQDFSLIPEESKTAGSFFDSREECLGLGLPGDCLIGLKYRYFITDLGVAHLYSSMGAGFGRVRQWLQLKEPYYEGDGRTVTSQCKGKDQVSGAVDYCYVRDTVRPGWMHVGFGVGTAIPVHEHIDLLVDSYLMVLLPETGLNLDVNLGANFRF